MNDPSTLEQRARDLLADELKANGMPRINFPATEAAIRAIITALSEAPAVGDGEVIQADRDAAEPFRRGIGGGYDRKHEALVQAFRRHRLTALSERDAVAGWQPIETSPEGNDTDGPFFDVAWPGGNRVIGCYKERGTVKLCHGYPAVWTIFRPQPTHWMPTPTPPEGEE